MIVGLMGVVFQVWLLHVRAEAVKNSTLSVGVSPCKRLVLIRIMKSTTQFPNYVKHFLIKLPVGPWLIQKWIDTANAVVTVTRLLLTCKG